MTEDVGVPEFPDQAALVEGAGGFTKAKDRFAVRQGKGEPGFLTGETKGPRGCPEDLDAE
ncbi:MAG: hypothetical protein V9G08_03695 [Dermatophilaceae bacterium]